MNRISRRFFPLAGILGLSLLSCGREVTGPADGLWFGRNPTAALAIDPRFPPLPGGNFASDLVPFVRVRITVRNLEDKVVKDTTVDFPSNVDSIALTLTVPLPTSTAAGGVPLTLAMAFVNAAGDTVFRGGPSAIVARPRGAAGASQPIVIPVAWVPPGAVPASVVLTPTTGSVVSGTTTVFRATAFSSVGDSIPNTPIVFTVDTAARATLVTVGSTSTATWQPNAGNVRVIASTLNLRADTSFFVVSLPVSTQLAITAAPTTAVAGTTLSAITVAVRDASNVLTPLFTGPVTLTLNAGATGATLAGTATVNAVAGIATFNGLSIQRAATGLTLTASSGALTPATSAALAITPAAPAALVTLAGDAQSGTLGQPLTDSVDVQLRDAFANPIVGSSIAFSVTSGGGSISPASVVTGANGRARARWTLGTSVGAQTARAQLVGVPAVFAAVGATGVPGAPSRLEIVTEPAATQVAGVAIAPAITVRVVDAVGATVTSFTGTVGLALAANPGATTPTGVLAIAAVSGVASFTTVAIPAAAAGYTFAATSGALTPDTTVAFTVLNAAAAQMALVSGGGQSATVGAALAAPLVVRITDAFGNGVPGFAVNWAITTGAGTLSAASSATNATGVASNTLTLSNTAGGVVVSATASGITGSPQQFAATALAGAVTQLAYTLNTGGGTAGVPITPGWVIQARDAQANLVTGFNGPVTVVLSNGPGGATLGGTTTVNAVGGIATFANLTVDRIASSWVLVASSPGLSNASSAAFFITPAAAAAIAVQAGNAQTAAVLTQVAGQITFRVSDAFGNPTNGTALTVTVTSGGGSVGTASGVTNVSGELSTTWTLGNTLGAQSVTATVTLTPALQAVATATATPGAATTLVITTGPIGPQVAGVPLQDVVVQARDGAGNLATGFSGTVRALVGGTLPDSAFATAVGGVATFTGAFFETSGTFFVRFSAPGLTEAVSDTFAVAPAAATQMVLSSGNGQNGIAGQLLPLPVVVRIEDPFLNRVPGVTVSWVMFRGVDTLAVNTNVSDANGLATWRPTLPTSVTAVQIIARSTGLTNSPITVTENVFGDVTTQLTMFTQPVGGAAGATLPASAVRARDQYGNFKVAFTGNVTAAIDSGPAGAVLSGTTTVAAVGGTATFSTLAVDVAGTYRLRYSSVGLTNALSTAFVITPSAAATISVQAGNSQTAAVLTQLAGQVTFRVTDAFGNPTSGTALTVAVTTGGGSVGTVSGVTNVSGEFSTTWTMGGLAGAQSITATLTALPTAQAVATATATAGSAVQLVLITALGPQVSGVSVGDIVVEARDAAGNRATGFNGVVSGRALTGPNGPDPDSGSVNAVAGVATFSGQIFETAGDYTLRFNSVGLTDAISGTITVTAGAAARIDAQSATTLSGFAGLQTLATVQVRVEDAFLNTVAGTSLRFALVRGVDTLSATTVASDANGLAGWQPVLPQTVGPLTRVIVTAAGLLNSPLTFTMNVFPGPVSTLRTVGQPITTTAGATLNAISVEGIDQFGNRNGTFNASVTVAVDSGPAGAVLSGTTTLAAVSGLATFSTLSLNLAGTYRVRFTTAAAGVAATVSNNFVIGVGAPATLSAVLGNAQTGIAGAVLPTPLTARVADALGNPVAGVTVTWAITAGGGSLSVTSGVTSATGQLSTVLTLPTVAGGVTVQATSAGLTGSPLSFTATATVGAANQLTVTTPAAGATNGAAFTTQPVIAVRDVVGNLIVTDNSTVVTMVVSSGGTVVGTASATAVNGVATFATVGIAGVTATYTLTFNATGLNAATQTGLALTAGAASQLVVTTAAAGAASGTAFTTQPIVAVRDAANNLVSTDNTSLVTMTVSAGATDVGTATATAAAGVATFTNVGLSGLAATYTLTFSSGVLTSATPTIALTAGAASQLVVTTAAAGAASGTAFATQPVVAVRDAANNLVTTDNTSLVTMTVSAGATVVGTATATASGGVATFTNVGLSGLAATYTLTFSSGALTTATPTIVLTAGAATQLLVTTAAAGATNGVAFSTQPVVGIQDAAGNLVTTDNSSVVTMTVSAGAAVVGTATATATGGVATFTNVGLGGIAGTYTLTFSRAGLTSATPTIVLTAGAATQLLVTTAAAGAASGVAFTTQPVVQVRDAAGNLVVTDNASVVTMAVSAGATIVGTATATATGGVATFTNAGLSGALSTYTLTFSRAGLAAATQPITIAGAAAPLLSWTGAVNNSWGVAGNWNLGRLPQPTDSVFIAPGVADTVDINVSTTVAFLVVAGAAPVTINHTLGATLQVDSAAILGVNSTFNMSGGSVLTGDAGVQFAGPLNWNGGTMTGTGLSLVASGATATVATTGAVTLNGRDFIVGGTANVGGSGFSNASAPTITVLPAGTLAFTTTATFGSGVDIVNAGLLRKSSSAGQVRLDWAITNTGTIEVADDTLLLLNILSHNAGTVAILPNAALIVGGETMANGDVTIGVGGRIQLQANGFSANSGRHVFGPASRVSGLGKFQTNSADTVRIQGAFDVDSVTVLNGQTFFESATDTMFVGNAVYISGGFLRGTGIIGVRSSFTNVSGNFVGSGTVAVLPGAIYRPQADVSGWKIDVRGTMIWGDLFFSLAQDPLTAQFGSIDVRSGGVVDIQHGATDRDIFGGSALVTTRAGGTIRKSSGTGISTFRQIVSHSGVFDVLTGTLNMQTGSCTVTGGTKTGVGTLIGGCVVP